MFLLITLNEGLHCRAKFLTPTTEKFVKPDFGEEFEKCNAYVKEESHWCDSDGISSDNTTLWNVKSNF